MTETEINKTIAEFMCWSFHKDYPGHVGRWLDPSGFSRCSTKMKFTKSLDALVPVWEKLELSLHANICRSGFSDYHVFSFPYIESAIESSIRGKPGLQFAAAHATAKAILALKGGA